LISGVVRTMPCGGAKKKNLVIALRRLFYYNLAFAVDV